MLVCGLWAGDTPSLQRVCTACLPPGSEPGMSPESTCSLQGSSPAVPCAAKFPRWLVLGGSFFFPRHVDLTLLSPLGGSDDPLPLHLLDDPRRAVEPDLETALEEGDGGAAGADDFLDGGVEHLVARRVGILRGRGCLLYTSDA